MTKDISKDQEFKQLVNKAGALLGKKKNTIAVAESVTSGNVQAALSLAKDASTFFQGGITVYNIGQKCRHLLVEPTHAMECDCVSKKVSDQMALQVTRFFSADYGIGITGYASLVPEENVKKLFAYISIAKNNRLLLSKKINALVSDPPEVQAFYTRYVIKMLVSVLGK